jgi:hypothetical protein
VMGKSRDPNALDNLLTAVQDFARARREQAQAGLERERHAYWIHKAAEKVRRQDRSIGLRAKGGSAQKAAGYTGLYGRTTSGDMGVVPNRADMRANQAGGMIWSQRHRPARPSDALLREQQGV